MSKHIVIIGAGIGGLSAAIRLAAAGQRVTVLEKNAAVGGKMGEVCVATATGRSAGTPARRSSPCGRCSRSCSRPRAGGWRTT